MKIEEMIAKNRADCSGCSACKNICPKDCITMQRDDEGFSYPSINHDACIKCGQCEKVCPALNFVTTMPDHLPEVFVAVHHNEKIRRHSSSGGAFTAFSELILNEGGIVVGAGFDENWRVVHTCAENLDELENLRGSKYVQSEIGDVYKRVKSELEKGRRVLFSGTPCQCAGLKGFLGKDYPNLLTVDIICHGTPSPLLWESYIEYIARGHDIARVNFRSKRFGWTNNHLEITFYDCGYYAKPNGADLYLKNFLQSVIERPSCHDCKFKFPNGKSDLTIGDAWGVQNFAPKMFDNRGTSLVIVHTDKGRNFLSQEQLITYQVPFDVLPEYNPCFITPSIPDSRRKNFFDDLKNAPNLSIDIMKQYFYQNPGKIFADGRNLNAEAIQKYVTILNHWMKLRTKNLLFIMLPLDNTYLNDLTNHILTSSKDAGIYILQLMDDGNAIMVDALHPIIRFNVQANLEDIRELIENFHITDILIDDQIDFSAEGISFLENTGVMVEKFDLSVK